MIQLPFDFEIHSFSKSLFPIGSKYWYSYAWRDDSACESKSIFWTVFYFGTKFSEI
jgi:hypothetical protein